MARDIPEYLEFDPLGSREEIDIPSEPTPEWSDFISAYFGDGSFNTIVSASTYLRDRQFIGRMKGHRRIVAEKTLDADYREEPHVYAGRFHGMEIRPEFNEQEEIYYVPYARLTNVYDISEHRPLAVSPEEDILVPILNTSVIVLHRY